MNNQRTSDLDLAGHRMAKGISLGWIASSTMIGRHFLEAIESEHFEKLPGGVYSLSYLRQYARAIGFDEAALLSRYRAMTQPVLPAEAVASNHGFFQWLRLQPIRAFIGHLPHRQRGKHA